MNGIAARQRDGACADRGAELGSRETVIAAWESFAAGADVDDDALRGVRPEILISWYRCRDEYRVDPELTQAPSATEVGDHSLDYRVVFAQLGGLAARVTPEVEALGGIVTVTDAEGRILACWGHPDALHRAEKSNLAPWATWSEWASGTNGMGTALESYHPLFVEGPEHWCQGFHGWSCAGIAVRDVVTDAPLAALNVSCYHARLPEATGEWLQSAAATVRDVLMRRERRSGDDLLAAFAQAASRASAPVAAVDIAGKVLAANEYAGPLLGVPAHAPAADPERRWVSQVAELATLAAQATAQARRDPSWIGSTHLYLPFTDSLLPVTVRPVLTAGRVIGLLLSGGPPTGEPLPPAIPLQRRHTLVDRIAGRRDGRLILLSPHEVRFAEADGNTVWLASDRGRLQAATHGLDHLEQQLAEAAFLRVHRRYLVNLRRIREVESGFKGALFVITDARPHETVPVSRRHAAQLRQALGV